MVFFDGNVYTCSYTLATFPELAPIVTLTERICHGRRGDDESGGVELVWSTARDGFVIPCTDTLRSRCLVSVCLRCTGYRAASVCHNKSCRRLKINNRCN